MDNSTLVNLTGNITGPAGPVGWGDWIGAGLKWICDTLWNIIGMATGIMDQNPIVGFIILLLIVVIIFWLGWWVTMASTQGMRMFLIIGLLIIVVFVIWYLWGEFGLPDLFSGWVKGSMGIENATANITQNVTDAVKDNGGISFWT